MTSSSYSTYSGILPHNGATSHVLCLPSGSTSPLPSHFIQSANQIASIHDSESPLVHPTSVASTDYIIGSGYSEDVDYDAEKVASSSFDLICSLVDAEGLAEVDLLSVEDPITSTRSPVWSASEELPVLRHIVSTTTHKPEDTTAASVLSDSPSNSGGVFVTQVASTSTDPSSTLIPRFASVFVTTPNNTTQDGGPTTHDSQICSSSGCRSIPGIIDYHDLTSTQLPHIHEIEFTNLFTSNPGQHKLSPVRHASYSYIPPVSPSLSSDAVTLHHYPSDYSGFYKNSRSSTSLSCSPLTQSPLGSNKHLIEQSPLLTNPPVLNARQIDVPILIGPQSQSGSVTSCPQGSWPSNRFFSHSEDLAANPPFCADPASSPRSNLLKQPNGGTWVPTSFSVNFSGQFVTSASAMLSPTYLSSHPSPAGFASTDPTLSSGQFAGFPLSRSSTNWNYGTTLGDSSTGWNSSRKQLVSYGFGSSRSVPQSPHGRNVIQKPETGESIYQHYSLGNVFSLRNSSPPQNITIQPGNQSLISRSVKGKSGQQKRLHQIKTPASSSCLLRQYECVPNRNVSQPPSDPRQHLVRRHSDPTPPTAVPTSNGLFLACAVCNEQASGEHFGVLCCESCKGFFRRTVKKELVYTCREQQCCPVERRTRNRCQFCRYNKCLALGMKVDVLSKERSCRKSSVRLRSSGSHYSSGLNCDSSTPGGLHSDREVTVVSVTPLVSSLNACSVISIVDRQNSRRVAEPPCSFSNSPSKILHCIEEAERLLLYSKQSRVNRTSTSQPTGSQNHPGVDIKPVSQFPENLFSIKCPDDHSPLADILIWSKELPFFNQFPLDIRLALLKSACLELLLSHWVHHSCLSGSDTEIFSPGLRSSFASGHAIVSSSEYVLLDPLCRSCSPSACEDAPVQNNRPLQNLIENAVHRLIPLRLSAVEMGSLKMIILLNPDAVDLPIDFRADVEVARDMAYAGLEYNCSRFWPNAPHGRMGRLLLRIPALHLLTLRVQSLMNSTGGLELLNSRLESIFRSFSMSSDSAPLPSTFAQSSSVLAGPREVPPTFQSYPQYTHL